MTARWLDVMLTRIEAEATRSPCDNRTAEVPPVAPEGRSRPCDTSRCACLSGRPRPCRWVPATALRYRVDPDTPEARHEAPIDNVSGPLQHGR